MDPQTQTQPSAFQQQKDGGFLPSPELMERIRSNPEQYPDAANDFSVLSGGTHTPEQVQDIIDNPMGAGGIGDHFIPGADELVIDAAQGTLTGIGVASDKLFGAGGDTLRRAANWLDPKFETEKGIVETVAEIGGQAIPAIAATVGTGGVAAGVIAGAGAATGGCPRDNPGHPRDRRRRQPRDRNPQALHHQPAHRRGLRRPR
jgi:hypothetical protein